MSWDFQYFDETLVAWSAVYHIDNPWEAEVTEVSLDVASKLRNGKECITRNSGTWQVLKLRWDMKADSFRTAVILAWMMHTCKFTDINGTVYIGKIDRVSSAHVMVAGAVGVSLSIEFRQIGNPIP